MRPLLACWLRLRPRRVLGALCVRILAGAAAALRSVALLERYAACAADRIVIGKDRDVRITLQVRAGHRFADHEPQHRAEQHVREVVLALVDAAPADEPGQDVAGEPQRPAVVFIHNGRDREGARRMIRRKTVMPVLELVAGTLRVRNPFNRHGYDRVDRVSRDDGFRELVQVFIVDPKAQRVNAGGPNSFRNRSDEKSSTYDSITHH